MFQFPLPPWQSPTGPCLDHEAGEGAERACGRGGEGVCARGVCPALLPVEGRGRWVQRGECEGRDNLPSDKRNGRGRGGERERETEVIIID